MLLLLLLLWFRDISVIIMVREDDESSKVQDFRDFVERLDDTGPSIQAVRAAAKEHCLPAGDERLVGGPTLCVFPLSTKVADFVAQALLQSKPADWCVRACRVFSD